MGRLAARSGALVLLLGLGAAAGHPASPPPPAPTPPPAAPPAEPAALPEDAPPDAPAPAPAPAPAETPAPEDAAQEPEAFPPLLPDPTPEELLESGPTEVTIYLKDGQRFSGLLVDQTPDHLVLRIEGIQTKFLVSAVDRIRTLRPVLDRYEEMRAAMGEDPAQIVKLADWLRAREHHELALDEVERALRIAPDNLEARRLRVLIAKQIELRERARISRPGDGGGAAPAPAPLNELQRDFPLLTAEQINLMKVYEVDLASPPRVVIRRETVKKLLEQNRTHPMIPPTQEGRDAIYRRAPREILELMFRLQARDLYPEVTVVDQPESVRLFRDQVHRTWLINSCATNACHGGQDAGRLMLSNRRPNADASVYTNLLIMERFRLADGTPLLNYENPERSPLLQLALPRGDAMFQHPMVAMGANGSDGWKPVFRSPDDRRFQDAMGWMRSMYRPRPEYPIDYVPPGSSTPAAPAAAPLADPLPR